MGGVTEGVPGPADPGGGAAADRERFDRLYAAQFASIYAYFVRRADATDAPDLVAEVFATAWRRRPDVPPEPHDRLWLYGVARRVMSSYWRAHQRRRRLLARVGRQTEPATVVWGRTERRSDELHAALRNLRAQDRELVRLIVWEQLSHSEAAVVLGCSANAVAIRWHRALKRLRRELGVSAGTASEPARCAPPPIAGEHR